MVKFKGTLIGAASGSLGGDTYSHNRGGQYIRNRTIPVQPNTVPQLSVRTALSTASGLWVFLTQVQRDGWDVYSLQVPLANALGRPVNVGGKNMFVRGQHARVRIGIAFTTFDAPTLFTQDGLSPVSQSGISVGFQHVVVNFDVNDGWVSEDGAFFELYASRGVSQGINYFKGPYLLAGHVLGNSVTPPTSPRFMGLPFTVVAGDKVFFRVKSTRADNRVSPDQRFFGIAV